MRVIYIQPKSIIGIHKSLKFRLISTKALAKVLCLAGAITIFTSCEKFVTVDNPTSKIVSEAVFESDATALSAMDAVYTQMQQEGFASGQVGNSVVHLAGLSADLLQINAVVNWGGEAFSDNELSADLFGIRDVWQSAYKTIYMTNAILEGVKGSSTLSADVKDRLTGESLFIRAFCHFYLVNLYGEVPLITTTDYRVNSIAARESAEVVYQQIVDDLTTARDLLGDEYVSFDRIIPNKNVVTAFLARVYLYTGNWSQAEQESSVIIQSGSYNLPMDLSTVFENSEEVIWQMLPVYPAANTNEGSSFILSRDPSSQTPSSLSSDLLNSFEAGDARLTNWVGTYVGTADTYYYPYKYKVQSSSDLTEYSVVIRLAEMYLIRAEARAKQGKLLGASGAESDINAIRQRAGLLATNAKTETELLDAIMQERKVELFAEWGHRWFDLIRTNRADQVLGSIKQGWDGNDTLWPIPETDLKNNPFLTQNPGY